MITFLARALDKKRVEDIRHGILSRKLDFQWRANCQLDYLATYDKDFLELLEKAGCVELDFGGESGSDRLQQFICKDVTAGEMLKSVENLRRWAPSIEPYVSCAVMNRIAKYRWKHRYFGFPIELKIADAVARKFKGFF